MRRVVFPRIDRPLVSVVMVTYGAGEWVMQALEKLSFNTAPCYEAIVVDNASPDDTPELVRTHVEGATLIFNDRNVGFGPAANQAALRAVGRYLCFLNSDALVLPGWLPPLLEVLEADPRAEIALPCLLDLDGTIQEAGSLVGSDGSTQAFGSGNDPGDLGCRFRRYVDYGSAACWLIRRSTFLNFGGFDPVYPIAYCEDVDLCFSLAEVGLRTVYEPRSRVRHVRGASSDVEQARHLMGSNRAILRERWGAKLARRPSLADLWSRPHRAIAARDAEALDRVLVIDDRVPHSDRGSGDPRMAKLLIELADLWPLSRITLLAVDGREAERYAPALLERGIEVVAGSPDWERWLEGRRFHYSVVIVSRPHNFEHFHPLLRRTQPQALLVLDIEALFFRRMERQQRVLGPSSERAELEALEGETDRMRDLEIEAIRSADAALCVAGEEERFVQALVSETPTFLVPSFVEVVERPPGFEERRDILFFGGFMGGPGSPNEDAVVRLVRDVMPPLWALDPDLVLHVVGADPTPAVRLLHGGRVNVVGFVPDPVRWLDRARVHVVPLRFGSGIALKLVETMGRGLPFVTTRMGSSGLHLDDLEPILLANDLSEMVNLVWALYTDRSLWQRAQQRLLELAETWFSRPVFRQAVVDAMTGLGLAPPEPVARPVLAAAR